MNIQHWPSHYFRPPVVGGRFHEDDQDRFNYGKIVKYLKDSCFAASNITSRTSCSGFLLDQGNWDGHNAESSVGGGSMRERPSLPSTSTLEHQHNFTWRGYCRLLHVMRERAAINKLAIQTNSVKGLDKSRDVLFHGFHSLISTIPKRLVD